MAYSKIFSRLNNQEALSLRKILEMYPGVTTGSLLNGLGILKNLEKGRLWHVYVKNGLQDLWFLKGCKLNPKNKKAIEDTYAFDELFKEISESIPADQRQGDLALKVQTIIQQKSKKKNVYVDYLVKAVLLSPGFQFDQWGTDIIYKDGSMEPGTTYFHRKKIIANIDHLLLTYYLSHGTCGIPVLDKKTVVNFLKNFSPFVYDQELSKKYNHPKANPTIVEEMPRISHEFVTPTNLRLFRNVELYPSGMLSPN